MAGQAELYEALDGGDGNGSSLDLFLNDTMPLVAGMLGNCSEVDKVPALYPLLAFGICLNSVLVITAIILVVKLRPLLSSYAVTKACLIGATAAAGIFGMVGLLEEGHLVAILALGPHGCEVSQVPLFACALWVQASYNAFRVSNLCLAALACDRLYFAIKLVREMGQSSHHATSSMYHSGDPPILSRWDRMRKRLRRLRSAGTRAAFRVLDAVRISSIPVLFLCLVFLSLLVSLAWWISVLTRPSPLANLWTLQPICSSIGQYGALGRASIALDQTTTVVSSWVALAASLAYHRICRTQLSNFARSQYHIALTVRIKLRKTVTLGKMLIPPILANIVWQTTLLAFTTLLDFLGLPFLHQQDKVLHAPLLWTRAPPLVFFCVACIIRVNLEKVHSVGVSGPATPGPFNPSLNPFTVSTHLHHPGQSILPEGHSVAVSVVQAHSTTQPDSLPPLAVPFPRPASSGTVKTGLRPLRSAGGPVEIDSDRPIVAGVLPQKDKLGVSHVLSSIENRNDMVQMRRSSTVVSLPPIRAVGDERCPGPSTSAGLVGTFSAALDRRHVERSSSDHTSSSPSTAAPGTLRNRTSSSTNNGSSSPATLARRLSGLLGSKTAD